MGETDYREVLTETVERVVEFVTHKGAVTAYKVVLVVLEDGEWKTVRVFDNVHGPHDMHRHTKTGGKQEAETFHQGTAQEALHEALKMIDDSSEEMVEGWRR